MIVADLTVTVCWWLGSRASPSVTSAGAPCPKPSSPRRSRNSKGVAGDRPDLLAEEAGILIGASEGRLDEPRAGAAAQLCIAAGADESLIPGWIEEGRCRAEAARHPPFSGGVR